MKLMGFILTLTLNLSAVASEVCYRSPRKTVCFSEKPQSEGQMIRISLIENGVIINFDAEVLKVERGTWTGGNNCIGWQYPMITFNLSPIGSNYSGVVSMEKECRELIYFKFF